MSEDNIPDVFREPSEFLRSLVTDLLQYCPQLHEQDPQSCHGRLVQDICLETPHLKTSKFSQAKKALIEEVKVNKISENFQNCIFRKMRESLLLRGNPPRSTIALPLMMTPRRKKISMRTYCLMMRRLMR